MVRGVEDLRTRIAAVVYAHDCWDYAGGLECRCGSQFSFDEDDPQGDAITPWSEHVAEALVRELGLRREGLPSGAVTEPVHGSTWFRQGGFRWVTEWVPGE